MSEAGKNISLDLSKEEEALLADIIKISGQNVNLCFQCRKCTAGCPVVKTGAMDITPTQVIHLVRLGQVEKILNSHTVWVCASCETCTTSCPQGVDIAKVMDASRICAKKLNKVDAEKRIDAFLSIFMDSIEKYGTLYELGLVMNMKLRTKDFFSDIGLGTDMFLKGKLEIIPHKLSNVQEIRDMIKKIRELEST